MHCEFSFLGTASILSPCLLWRKHNFLPLHFAVGKKVVNSDKWPLRFSLQHPGAIYVRKCETEFPERNSRLLWGAWITAWEMGPRTPWRAAEVMHGHSEYNCVPTAATGTVLLPGVCGRLSVAPFWSLSLFIPLCWVCALQIRDSLRGQGPQKPGLPLLALQLLRLPFRWQNA